VATQSPTQGCNKVPSDYTWVKKMFGGKKEPRGRIQFLSNQGSQKTGNHAPSRGGGENDFQKHRKRRGNPFFAKPMSVFDERLCGVVAGFWGGGGGAIGRGVGGKRKRIEKKDPQLPS